jgi:hypothetical protein
LASLGVSLEGRSSSQGDSVDLELRHCVSEGTLSELDLAHVSKCALGRQQWSQSNGAGDFEYDRRANVDPHSVTARNH